MKFGMNENSNFNRFRTLNEYTSCINNQGETWFSTNDKLHLLLTGEGESVVDRMK